MEVNASVDRGVLQELLKRVEASEVAIEHQDSTIRLLKNEWGDVLDRANRVMGRLNARIRKFEAQDSPERDAEPQEGAGAYPGGTHALLSTARARRSG